MGFDDSQVLYFLGARLRTWQWQYKGKESAKVAKNNFNCKLERKTKNQTPDAASQWGTIERVFFLSFSNLAEFTSTKELKIKHLDNLTGQLGYEHGNQVTHRPQSARFRHRLMPEFQA